MPESRQIEITCDDGLKLHGHLWIASSNVQNTVVIINCATGVAARYYYRYAAFLAERGLHALTYDYRGIGASRPLRLKDCGYRWRDWGELDFEAALRFVNESYPSAKICVVGHSFGGFLPGFSKSGHLVDCMITVGAQYAWWPDYAVGNRLRLFVKWHIIMPVMTAAFGYFPGRKLGWLEDLPAGVAQEWSFRRKKMENNYPQEDRAGILQYFLQFRARILAIAVADDDIASLRSIRRGLSYYKNAKFVERKVTPSEFGVDEIGHFGLFHSRHSKDLWKETIEWLTVQDRIFGSHRSLSADQIL